MLTSRTEASECIDGCIGGGPVAHVDGRRRGDDSVAMAGNLCCLGGLLCHVDAALGNLIVEKYTLHDRL